MKLTDSQLCNFCNIKEETIMLYLLGVKKRPNFEHQNLMQKGNINFDLSPSILLFRNWHLELGKSINNIISILAKRIFIFSSVQRKSKN